jgi:hypothetical protein
MAGACSAQVQAQNEHSTHMGEKPEKYVPYSERSDDDKLLANWKKAKALFGRSDWYLELLG